MNIIAAWRARRTPELEQAILRLVIAGIVTFYLCVAWVSGDSHLDERDIIILTGLAVWCAYAIGTFFAIWIWPALSATRRVLGILVDVGLTTFALFLMGERGVFLVGVYLFLIFGNGFRFGRVYLHVSQILSLIGFVLVLSMVPWWQHEPQVGLGLL